MPAKQCFVIMPIGDQSFGDVHVTAAELRKRYDDLIKEALKMADPALEVTRADDVAMPGTITSDILTRIMHSDLVVADVTYPNPNVFYELGLRHACRLGTIIVREKTGPRLPFDISHQRAIEYSNTPTGLKDLAENLRNAFALIARNPAAADNHFQEFAQLTRYRFPDYSDKSADDSPEVLLVMEAIQTPALLDLFAKAAQGDKPDPATLLTAMANNPRLASLLAKMMVKSGGFSQSPERRLPPPPRPGRGKRKR